MNILTQIGFVVLVGLAAKNAILTVEAARQREDEGQGALDAVVAASRPRLRATPVTSLAFVLGVLPSARPRSSAVTTSGPLFTPVFYLATRRVVGPERSAPRGTAKHGR